jgi:dynein heavy chain 2
LNPKALPKSALLGYLNQDTREFTSGVLTAAARSAAREPTEVLCWVICDGDVDPEWIEALNSVLDDNRLLTLPTGERISFSNNVNFIFETNDL